MYSSIHRIYGEISYSQVELEAIIRSVRAVCEPTVLLKSTADRLMEIMGNDPAPIDPLVGVLGTIKIAPPNPKFYPELHIFAQQGVPVAKVWEFTCMDPEDPAIFPTVWDVFRVFTMEVAGWYWLGPDYAPAANAPRGRAIHLGPMGEALDFEYLQATGVI